MRTIVLTFTLFCSLNLSGQNYLQSVTISPSNPSSCDQVTAIVKGTYPNTACFYDTSYVQYIGNDLVILYIADCSGIGLTVLTPFTQQINLGQLQAGNWNNKTVYMQGMRRMDSLSQNLIVTAGGNINADGGPDQLLCDTFSTTLSASSPDSGTARWHIINGNPNFSSIYDTSAVISNLQMGLNQIIWRVTHNNCSTDDTVNIVVDQMPDSAYAGPDQSVCKNQVSVYMNADLPQYLNGEWKLISGMANIDSSSSPTSSVSTLGIGTNSFEWKISSSGSCPELSDTVDIIVVDTSIAVNAGQDTIWCESDMILLEANSPGNASGEWEVVKGKGVIQNPMDSITNVSGSSKGYNIFVWTIDIGNCKVTDSVSMWVDSLAPQPNLGSDQAFCEGDSLLFDHKLPGYGTHNWTLVGSPGTINENQDSTRTYIDVQNTSAGNYSIVLEFMNGACLSIDSLNIELHPAPSPAITMEDTVVCDSNSIEIHADSLTNGSGMWTATGGASVTDPNKHITRVSGLSLGANVIYWTTSSPECPQDEDTLTVRVRTAAQPTITVSGNTLTSSPADNYQWIRNTIAISGETQQSYTATTGGQYQVAIWDENSCTDTSVIEEISFSGIRNTQHNEVTLFPNPADAFINLEFDQAELEISIYNNIGSEIITYRSNNSPYRIDVSSLPAGFYYLVMKTSETIMHEELIIE